MKPEQHDADRLPIPGELHGELMVYQPMVIREIGAGGATIETGFPLQLNSLHDLRLTLAATAVVVKGRVVHSHISEVDQDIVTYSTSLEFVEPSPRVVTVIDQYLRSVRALRNG